MKSFNKAHELLKEFKGDAYLFGNCVLENTGQVTAKMIDEDRRINRCCIYPVDLSLIKMYRIFREL